MLLAEDAEEPAALWSGVVLLVPAALWSVGGVFAELEAAEGALVAPLSHFSEIICTLSTW
jgi:hypothetical protein